MKPLPTIKRRAFFSLILALVLTGCVTHPPSKQTASPSFSHRIQSEQLRSIMRQLNSIVYDPSKSPLQIDDDKRRYALTLAKKLKEFSHQVQALPAKESSFGLTGEVLHQFTGYAQAIDESAQIIETLAENYQVEKLDGAFVSLHHQCQACHAAFRKPLHDTQP